MARLRSHGLDLVGDGRDDAVADLVEHEERVVQLCGRSISAQTMRAVRVSASSTDDGEALALAPHAIR